uniref:Uncharacterized protein n=1 Tax=Clastoptera arizonana TaxID=38151 RepID=A0A1B6CAT0_9HEMI
MNRTGQSEWVRYPYQTQAGIYGWHKRFLYFLVLSLLAIVIVNVALTMWIIKVLGFNSLGMGDLILVQQGVQLPNVVYVLGSLITSLIYSYQPMTINSNYNFSISTKDSNGKTTNKLHLDENTLQLYVDTFLITNKKGTNVLLVNQDEVVLNKDYLQLDGEGGTKFEGKVETSLVQAEKNDLRLDSPGGAVEVYSPAGVSIKSHAGEINVTSGFNIKLNSGSVSIHLKLIIYFFMKY